MRAPTLLSHLLLLFSLASTFQSANAQLITWNGGTGAWSDPSGWDCTCIPADSNAVLIQNGDVTIQPGTHAMAESVEIISTGTLTNFDTLTAGSAIYNTILNTGTLTNHGHIQINNGNGTGIRNRKTFFNYGTINIDSIPATSLSVDGPNPDTAYFYNSGTIDIISPAGVIAVNTTQNYFFHNDTSGILTVDGAAFPGEGLVIGGGQSMIFRNDGLVHLTKSGSSGAGRLVNTGTFQIHHPVDQPDDGFFVDILLNEPGGVLSIKNVSSGALVFNDTVINKGMILIDSTGGDAVTIASGPYWCNEGTISIKRTGRFGLNLYQSGSVFTNKKDGTLIIKYTQQNGIDMFGPNGSFYNNGMVIIDSIGGAPGGSFGDNGIYMRSGGYFKNDTCGNIFISNTNQTGFKRNSGNLSENFGHMSITKSGEHGIWPGGNSPFFNRAGGKIFMTEIELNGIYVHSTGFFGNGFFTNQGIVDIDTAIGEWSIRNRKTFVNDTCGVIYMEKAIRHQSGSWSNYGFIHATNTDLHDFGAAGTNYGVIEDLNGKFTDPQFVNDRIVISPKSLSICSIGSSGGSLANAFDLGVDSLANHLVLGIFKDSILSTVVGAFDAGTNSINLNANYESATDSILFVHVKNSIKNCVDTMRMRLTPSQPCPVSCGDGPHIWTGCGGTNEWLATDNWSRGSVPGVSDTVIILGNPPGLIFPEITTTETIMNMQLFPGALFTLKPTGNLNIND